jgi:hypothetical protein
MGTRSKIRLVNGDEYIDSKYYSIDGHVENFAPALIVALNNTTPKEILKNRLLFKLMSDDYTDDDMLSYLCEVDIAQDNYNIKIFNYEKELIFDGDLDKFSSLYDRIY